MSISSITESKKFDSSTFFHNSYVIGLAKRRIAILDTLERDPDLQIGVHAYFSGLTSYHKLLEKTNKNFLENDSRMARIQRVVLRALSYIWLQPTQGEVERVLKEYKTRIDAFAYRSGTYQKTEQRDVSQRFVKRLEAEVLAFKQKNLYSAQQKSTLTDHDRRQIRKMAQYEGAVATMLTDPVLKDNLFKNTIRNLYSVSCFIRFPATSKMLYKNRIAQQLNAWHGIKHIRRNKEANAPEVRIANQFVDILRTKNVRVTDEMVVPLEDIYYDFGSVEGRHGDYSVLTTGIGLWNIQKSWREHLSSGNSSLDQLPKEVVDVVSYEELKHLFPDLEYGDTIVSFCGSKESEKDDIDGSHGFVRVRKPCGDGKYEVYSLGVYAKKWPGVKGFIFFMGNTVEAGWCIPDPNSKYTHRKIGEIPRIIKANDVEGHRQFQADLERTLFDPELVFQFCGRNCAYEAEKLATNCKEPSLILTRIDKVVTPLLFKLWTIPYACSPERLKWAVLQVIVFTLGGFRTLYGKNLYNSVVATTAKFNYPGAVINQVEAGTKPGITFSGHNRDFEAVALAS